MHKLMRVRIPPGQEAACCAGARLLAHLATACSLRRFVTCAEDWATTLHPLLRSTAPPCVRVAGCAAAAAIVRRAAACLEGAPSLKRDVSALLTKAVPALVTPHVPPAAASADVTAACLDLLLAAASGACAGALRTTLDGVETFATCVLLDPAGTDRCVDAAVQVLAALPRVTGDGQAWSNHGRRVMLAAHDALDDALRSCETQAAVTASRGLLDAPGEAPPKPFCQAAHHHPAAAARLAALWLRVATAMMRLPYPVAVPFPAAALHALVARVVTCDGTPLAPMPGARPAPTSPGLLFALPGLHCEALNLLDAAVACAGRPGLLTASVPIMQTLRTALRSGLALPVSCGADEPGVVTPPCPEVRVHVYATCAHFLHILGTGFAVLLGPDIVLAARHDLAISHHASALGCTGNAGGAKLSNKKRKKDAAAAAAGTTQPGGKALLLGVTPADLAAYGAAGPAGAAVRIAALGALGAVSSVAGGALPEASRADLDAMVAHAATCCSADAQLPGAWDGRSKEGGEERVASLQALLACVLAPRPGRSPYLPLALALFRQGVAQSQQGGGPVAGLCWSGLLALEAIVHPVATPKQMSAHMAHPSSLAGSAQQQQGAFGAVASMGAASQWQADANGAPPVSGLVFAPPTVAVTVPPPSRGDGDEEMLVEPAVASTVALPARTAPAAAKPPLASAKAAGQEVVVHRASVVVARPPPAAAPVPPGPQRSKPAPGPPQSAVPIGDSDSEGPLPEIVDE